MAEITYTVREETKRLIEEVLRERARGEGVMQGPGFTTISTRPGGRRSYPLPSTSMVLVKITGNASGGGKYNGRKLTGTSNAAATGGLSASDLGTVPDADDCLILNLQEMDQATHDIDTSGTNVYFIGFIIGTSTAGLDVVAIDSSQWENCT